jgi:ATPase subunit of ABC transporter with duplicated ATPase domains
MGRPIRELSGGQQIRVGLAAVPVDLLTGAREPASGRVRRGPSVRFGVLMARGANALVLHEPTNHLDLEAQGELEQALSAFDGTLLVVSHDREFLAIVGVTRRVELADGQLVRDDAV